MKKVGITPGPVKFDNMEPNDVKQFTPSNTGTEGQILTKGNDGYGWGDLPSVDEFEPSNSGTEGQVLTKGNDGYGWQDPQGGSDVGCLASTQIFPSTMTVNTHADILANSPETFNALLKFDVAIRSSSGYERISGFYASLLFNKVPNSTLGYFANATLHFSGIYTNLNSVNPIMINIVVRATINESDNTKLDLKISGVAVFDKTYKDITSLSIYTERFDICGNEFEPENTGTLGDVLTKTATGYAWQTQTPSEYGPVQQSLTMNDTLSETTNLTQGTLNNESESLSDSLSITTSVEVVE